MSAFLSRNDFRRIRFSVALAVVMIAAGAAIAFGSVRLLDAERKDNREAVAKRNDFRARLSRAREEELELKQKISRFNALQARGVIGAEQRLEWVELIRQIRNTRKLFEIDYEIAPQRPLEAAVIAGASGGYEFFASTMHFKMPLLHEEDLLNFLADLRNSARATIRVRECKIARVPRTSLEGGGPTPQLLAECAIDWITIQERKGA